MKALKFLPALAIGLFSIVACNNNSKSANDGTSPGVNDTTSNNPTTDAMDYHADQRQQIPTPDSSNTIGIDTISGTTATPNTGTVKTYNAQKGDKDSSKH